MIFSGGKRGGGMYTAGQVLSGINERNYGNTLLNQGDNSADNIIGSAHVMRGNTNLTSAGFKLAGGAAKGILSQSLTTSWGKSFLEKAT